MAARPYLMLMLASLLAGQVGCLDPPTPDGEARVPIDGDMRDYARQARANLIHLPPEDRKRVEPALAAHERAIARYDRLMARGETRRKLQEPLIATGAFLLADDVTGIGVADDVALPFLALGVLGTALVTSGPANSQALEEAHSQVLETGRRVSDALRGLQASGIRAEPGTREFCIERYVQCQQTAPRGFPLSRCKDCMNNCIVHEFRWPRTPECDFERKRRPWMRRIRL